ncbi:MAG: DUF2461 domain-containing protein [Planctomycetota bacterium]|jgi:uncharacterized protein (TIGR02453 family)
MSAKPRFTPKLFRFLKDLAANNDRAWFQANKDRYETDVRDPMLGFIVDFAPKLEKIAPQLRADPRPVGGSMFRIYRDTRFSKDKSPYKTAASAHFRHATKKKDVHSPGLYLHLEPGRVFAGAGVWRPDGPSVRKIRDAIVAEPKRWKGILAAKAFRDTWKLAGDSLKNPPRGYDPEHPLVEDLKRKDFICDWWFTQKDVCAADFLDRFAKASRGATRFMGFLAEAVGLAW